MAYIVMAKIVMAVDAPGAVTLSFGAVALEANYDFVKVSATHRLYKELWLGLYN